MRRTANHKQDSHPQWLAFPSGLHLRPRWQHIARLQFKARGHNFNVELFPIHSPLLRESHLVSYPPLTYMLKFSGFANLTSCLNNKSSNCDSKLRDVTATAKSNPNALLSRLSHQSLVNPMPHRCPNRAKHLEA